MMLYEGFKIDAAFEQDVKDMFVELSDAEYIVEIDFLDKGKGIKDIMVNVEKDNLLFNSNDVKNTFLMLLDYTKIYHEVLTYKFATYTKAPNKTSVGDNIMSINTEYYNEFPDNIVDIQCIGIDIAMKSNNIITEK